MPPAAKIQAATNHPGHIAGPGASEVLIGGTPAAIVGDMHICALPPLAGPHPPSPIVIGSATVFIQGSPAARLNDTVGCGANIIQGDTSVLIGG
jgi:uncharacterized Zn-binding protein involved in type VI secretion